ncbi:receptor-type tyrosine-protein phosphatase eta [Labrus bergylta]|uniref:receptor-type tyrosine-protein phosphatase eta n=1 Tax=Labrus bergylta TaxID=56723 RepID=UPI0033139028
MHVTWSKPEGGSSFYRVQWTNEGKDETLNVTETHINITNLTAGVQYEISVIAVAEDHITEGNSTMVSHYTIPEVVEKLTVVYVTTSSISLEWTKPKGESSFYRVQWTDGTTNNNKNVTETRINVTDLTAGVLYDFTVIAVAGDNTTESEMAETFHYTKPNIIQNLTVTELTTSSMYVTWSKPEEGSSFYRVQWTNEGKDETLNVTETHINITNLTAGVQYEISVIAVAEDHITEGNSTMVSHYTIPEVVEKLTVVYVTTSSISLEWTKPKGESSFYRVQWTDGTTNNNKNVTETRINVTDLTAGVRYDFTVIAVAGDNTTESEMAETFHYTKPNIIQNLTVTELTTSSMYVTWSKPEGGSSFYRVQWTNEGKDETLNVTETHINITNLTAGVQYEISVIAVAEDHITEGNSTMVSHYTIPEVVEKLTVVYVTTSSISLKWTKPKGESSFYRVQWTDGTTNNNKNVTKTKINVTDLTAGVRYDFTVIAVAGDNTTESEMAETFHYTKPGQIVSHDESTNIFSIYLNWTQPPGEVFKYRVEWHNGGTVKSNYTNSAHFEVPDLIPGTSYTIQIMALNGANETGEPYTFTSVTKPAAVRDLAIKTITSSSVTLSWTKPEGNATSYIVRWAEGENSKVNTTINTFFTINDLTPGFQYSITVVAVAVNLSNKGEEISESTFTRPVKPVDITVEPRGTDSLNISWTLREGRVDCYMVNISNDKLMYAISNKTKEATFLFTGLHPGRVFNVTVTAVAGNFAETSDQSSFATYPTPPGSINISHRTNSSLSVVWATPALMENAPHISYHIIYYSSKNNVLYNYSNTDKIELFQLSSGTRYNISVQTVGPEHLKSSKVVYSTLTLPNPVLNLKSSTKSTTSVEVTWSPPQGVQDYYRYLVQTVSPTGTNESVSTNSAELSKLEPGTKYNISVRTIAAQGIESADEFTFSYTRPTAVPSITVENVTTTSVQLSWLRQSDHKPSYSYLVMALQDTKLVHNESTEKETYTFSDLYPGSFYTFKVVTVVDGVKSSETNISSYTKPAVVSDIFIKGSTTNLSVSWSQACGQVDSYTALLYRDGVLVGNSKDVNGTILNELFEDLKPGVLYCVAVVTKSGPFLNKSEKVCNATFPNPPGAIMVESQTVDSINFTWSLPKNMDHMQYNFSVSTKNGSCLVGNNSYPLTDLQSGSPYNISVVTVGVWNYESSAVKAQNYTKPHPVTVRGDETLITTNKVTLFWEQPEKKSHYSYVVEVSSGAPPQTVNETTITITGLSSGSNYSFTVTTQTADGTKAAPVAVSYFTRPYGVRQLRAEGLNTTAVRLLWNGPLEYKPEYTYRVETAHCDTHKNKTLTGNDTQISELTPGTECTFCVVVRAADGIEGEANCTLQYTKPEIVWPMISSQGSNSSVRVSWTEPPGRVERFEVKLNGTFGAEKERLLNSSHTFFLFEGLSAGRIYSAMVISVSGPFKEPSGFVTNATFPNPPGLIKVLKKTTSSLHIKWEEAPLMTGASFSYQLSNISTQGGEHISTTNTNLTFPSLQSGTPYSISVATVGVMGFQSEVVQIHNVTTRPFKVNSLKACEDEKIITATWVKPDQYKESYRFHLTLLSSAGNSSYNAMDNKFNFTNLDPGSHYNFSVITETFDGTQSDPTWHFTCTKASPVTDLNCSGPNQPNAEVVLNWTCPSGRFTGFRVSGNNNNSTSPQCYHTVSNLRHHTQYSMDVVTESCGQPSSPQLVSCWTGITDPPPPKNDGSLLKVKDKVYNMFSIQINSSLLNNTNGPITHVGVLVTADNLNTSHFRIYLEKTYTEWKAGHTQAYLATVKETNFQSRSGESQINIAVGDDTTWEGYTNSPLQANGNYKYAIVLFTDLQLKEMLVNGAQSLVSVTQFSTNIYLPTSPAVIGLATGATLGIFFILFIVLIGFIIYWKRRSKKETPDIQIHSMRAKSAAVRVEDFEAYYKKQTADSNCGFAEEFEDLKAVGTGQSKTTALTLENKPKNRYNNVLPYDSSRVKLSIVHGSPYEDYINANYMPGYNSRKEYIAAQGPLPHTVNEFWRMIWEKNVQTLVMLTRCNEQGRVKCEQYWEHGTKHYENIIVTETSKIPLKDWTIRDFRLKNVKTAETRSLRHFHLTAWPDHGVPETTELLISFRHLVREHMDQYSRHSPAVVHCSAGVGRTGTFIAIDHLIFQIERENMVDVFGIVHDLRMHRPLMVQTEDQYVFLHQCAIDIIRSRTGTNVDLIYQNTAALSIYENVEPKKNGYYNA